MERPLESIYSEVKAPSARAVEIIREHWDTVLGEWREQMRRTGVNIEEFERLVEIVHDGAMWLPGEISFLAFQQRFLKIGEQLADKRVSVSTTLISLCLLVETGMRYLQNGAGPNMLGSAVRRLYDLMILGLVAGYAKLWEAQQETLAQKLERAGQRQNRASAYVTNIYEQERRQLSHDLHDDIGHQLLLLKLYLELIVSDANKGEVPKLPQRLAEALGLVSSTIDSVRRLVLDLGPAIFDELGFVPAMRFYARQFSSRTAISVTVRAAELPEDLPASHQVALYRVLQGALSNVVEHARAGRVKVTIDVAERKRLIMVVEDNGVGFDPTSVSGRSFGLTAMRERVAVLGGRLQIESATATTRDRKTGTRVSVELPLPEASRDE